MSKATVNTVNNTVLYLGRAVDKASFRTFVYDKDGKCKLAQNYEEFELLTGSGLWHAEKQPEKAIDDNEIAMNFKRAAKNIKAQ